jgi:glycosidase
MKNSIKGFIVLFIALGMFACKDTYKGDSDSTVETNQEEQPEGIAPFSNEVAETAVIYEANIRQYSPEGTFNAFAKDIPQLKKLGVKILWLMPIYPISVKNRKGTGGGFVADMEDPAERAKMLGSYYAIQDYTEVNPEFGTKEDLDKLIKTAHDNGIYVILDWVANHTGWDHEWITEHPDYYTQKDGKISTTLKEDGTSIGWDDVADLNYDNPELRKAMIAEMKYWVTEHDIDGFRCDVAGFVPTDFWNTATTELEQEKELFMLAESEDKPLFKQAFDMGYNWEGHHIMNELAQGKAELKKWDEYMMKIDTVYEEDDYLMNFITNHDENSWNGTVKERMGDAKDCMLAFSYAIPGMPLIYSGQEYDMDKRLKFFEKDSIPKTAGKTFDLMVKLGELKNTDPALNGAANAAAYERLKSPKGIYAIKRMKDGDELYFVANMTSKPKTVTMDMMPEGEYQNLIEESTMSIKVSQPVELQPWQWMFIEQAK